MIFYEIINIGYTELARGPAGWYDLPDYVPI